jgi:hypothetical protein
MPKPKTVTVKPKRRAAARKVDVQRVDIPCGVCGDTWKATDGTCYSCWEERSYKADCAHYNTYGHSPTHGGAGYIEKLTD